MCETIFPQSPNWHAPKITTRDDGSVAYGSQFSIVILKRHENTVSPVLISDAHGEKVTCVVFSPNSTYEKIQNLIVSTSEDGFVKLWNVDTQSSEIGHNSHWVGNNIAKVVCGAWSQCSPKYIVSVADNDTLVLWNILDNTTTRFFIPKLKPSVVECSYHNDKIVAVGSNNGLVYVIKLHKKGEVIHKLRGHDKKVLGLSWCPTFSSASKSNDIIDQYLLASSSEEKEIYIWQTVDGACEAKIPLPKGALTKEKSHGHEKPDSENFIPIFWASSDLIYSGTKYGELICYNVGNHLTSHNENNDKHAKIKNANSWKLIHSYHSNGLLALAGIPVTRKNKSDDKVNTKIRNDLMSPECNNQEANGDCASNDNNVKEKEPDTCSTESKNLIWTTGKDQNLIAVYNDFDTYSPLFQFQSINGHSFDAAVSPHDPNKIALAVGDGKVRLWNASKSSSNVRVFWQKINGRVYSLAWHPHKEGLLAFGTSEGRVGLIDVYTQNQTQLFYKKHCRTVYRLAWGPLYHDNEKDSSEKKKFVLYSIGGNKLMLHDPAKLSSEILNNVNLPLKRLTDLAWKWDYSVLALGSERGNVYLLKPPKLDLIYTLPAFKKYIQSLAWHPTATTVDLDCSSFQGYFTFGSTDSESVIKVYNYIDEGDTCKVEQVAALKGHSSYIQCVAWSPHIAGRLISASADMSIRIWDVTTHTQLFKFLASQYFKPYFCVWSPIDPEVIITGYSERLIISWRISSANSDAPLLKDSIGKKGNNFGISELVDTSGMETTENKEKIKDQLAEINGNNIILATPVETQIKTKENKLFTKAWRTNTDPFEICYGLLKENVSESSGKFTLPFLNTENEVLDFLNVECEAQQKSNNWNEYYQMALWRGNLKEVIEEKVATGHLDDFLISLVPCVSPRLWQESCLSYSKTLSEKKNFKKAACYLLAIHKVHEAINLLSNADFHLEAIYIARCRLPESDPIFKNIVRRYADWLTKTGNLYKASECFIYLNEMPEVARILSKKNNPQYLSLAAIAAQKAGQPDLESQLASNALWLCLEALNWNLASQICDDHPDLKHLFFLYTTHTVVHDLDKEVLKLEKDLVTHLREDIGMEISYSVIYSSLSYVYDKNLIFTDKNKLYLNIALELCLACAAVEDELMILHILRAMNAASRFIKKGKETHPLYKLSSWLSPKGYLANESIFCRAEENIKSKIVSLRAFLCQAIVEHLDSVLDENEENFTCDVNDTSNLLRELMDDVLNKDTFTYFQNQVEIKLIERTIFDIYGRKNQNIPNLNKSHSDSKEDDLEDLAGSEIKNDCDENRERKIPEEIIDEEREKMNRLKAEIKNFETDRVVAPNPAVVYCTLRKVTRAFPDRDKDLVDLTEKKWKELETK